MGQPTNRSAADRFHPRNTLAPQQQNTLTRIQSVCTHPPPATAHASLSAHPASPRRRPAQRALAALPDTCAETCRVQERIDAGAREHGVAIAEPSPFSCASAALVRIISHSPSPSHSHGLSEELLRVLVATDGDVLPYHDMGCLEMVVYERRFMF
jgi:hypothetical protein